MSKKDSFNATKGSFSLYGGFFKDVAQELGLEKAVALHANQGKLFGAAVASMLKEELGRKKFNLATLESVYTKVLQEFGMTPEFEKGRSTLKVEFLRCPIYEGCVSAGLDHKTIELMCNQYGANESEEIRKVFPQLSGCLKFRSAPDEPCVEEFVVSKCV